MHRVAPALVLLLAVACAPGVSEDVPPAKISSVQVMSETAAEGFARAISPREFVFPDDHGPHGDYRTEWWYFTGNLASGGNHDFGFQLTIFRRALVAQAPARTSRWASRDIWFAHFALGDASSGRFAAYERFERGAMGLAGARARPFAAWLGDWRAESVTAEATFPMRLTAAEDGVALDLLVMNEKPLVLQGERGLSRKGPEPGNASYYYSATRLAAEGTVTSGGTTHPVSGTAWLDREWSTSGLAPDQLGWDWFSMQLADGRELMLYRFRRRDGSVDPFNSGTLVAVDGSSRRLGPEEVRYEPGRHWQSPATGASYPVEWMLTLPSLGLQLEVTPLLDAAELDLAVRYWEGAIRVNGREGTTPVSGRGFLEMTGYDSASSSSGWR